MENRRFTRVDFRVEGYVEGQSGSARGVVENLSLAGLLLRTDQNLPSGEKVKVRIDLFGQDTVSIEVDGRVVRQTRGSLAIELELDGIDVDSLTHLRHIVAYNIGDDEQVVSELLGHINRRKA